MTTLITLKTRDGEQPLKIDEMLGSTTDEEKNLRQLLAEEAASAENLNKTVLFVTW